MAKKKALVIVESPAKARKIGGFLGSDYIVKASVGHIRDLPSSAKEIPAAVKKEEWSRLGVNVEKDFEPLYVVAPEKKKIVKELKSDLKNVDELLIATDEDREGESIGWHLVQELKPKVPVKRMVFSEITKGAILEAVEKTRDIDLDLVQAQETRRVVDRLYGYTLSPLLWKKIKPKLSAGRVQSPAVKLVVERELERLAFRSGTYWDLKADLAKGGDATFEAELRNVGGKRVASTKDFDEKTGKLHEGADVVLLDEKAATELRERIEKGDWVVSEVTTKQSSSNPGPPFTTNSLLKDAGNKIGLSTRETMAVAQRLYEDGHITYMRTDSVNLSGEAVDAARSSVEDRYGSDYLHDTKRTYASKSENAQEAHEAIRPAGTAMKTAKELGLSGREAQLYDLIWKRTIATQMAPSIRETVSVGITAGDAEFRSSGTKTVFSGFRRAHFEGSPDPEAKLRENEVELPPLAENDKVECKAIVAIPHETKPPARFTEASLVEELEAKGIGRPSTYSSIMGTIQDRGYVRKQGKALVPTFTGMAVTQMLDRHFHHLVEYEFTAKMERTLDEIASGDADRLPYLKEFYLGDEGIDSQVKTHEEEIDPRVACTLKLDGFDADVRVGRYGPYFEKQKNGEKVTASIPDDVAPADLDNDEAEKLIALKEKGPESIGMHPEEGLPVFKMIGPFGPYLQLGETPEGGEPKPKRCSIPKNVDVETLDLDMAMKLFELPKRLGHHPVDDKVVNAGIGMYGPYVKHGKTYKSFDKTHTWQTPDGRTVDVLSVTLADAVEMLKTAKRRSAPEPIKVLGEHPEDGEKIGVYEGKYGPYVKWHKVNATVPKDLGIDGITLERALDLITKKAAKKGVKAKKKKAGPKKKAKKKSSKKKSPKAKSAAKKKAKSDD